jgi:hypothetical protein
VKPRQTSIRAFAADGSQLRAVVIRTGRPGCHRCERRAIGTVTVNGRTELGCIEHATQFCEVVA